MKLLTLKLNDKTFMSGKISMFLTKEALKIQRDALAVGKQAKGMSEEDIDGADELLQAVYELADRKIWLICEVYENKFSPDDLERGLTSEEVDIEINKIIGAVSGVIEKN